MILLSRPPFAVRAYHVATDFEAFDGGHLLVYAKSPGHAKALAMGSSSPYDFDDFTALKVRRAARMDGCKTTPGVVADCADLPEGSPRFYSTEEEWFGDDYGF